VYGGMDGEQDDDSADSDEPEAERLMDEEE
jgi:hypothetical protein